MENSASKETLPIFYFLEKDRLKSFKSWPFDETKICNTKSMAEAGFYWCGDDRENDTTACFICGKVLDGWEETDDPWVEHRKHAPQCAFLKYGKAQNELTVEELYNLIEVLTKQNLLKKNTKLKSKLEAFIEKKQNEMKNSNAT